MFGPALRYGLALALGLALTACAHSSTVSDGLLRGRYPGPCGPAMLGERTSGVADVTQDGHLVQRAHVAEGEQFLFRLPPGRYKVTLSRAGEYMTTLTATKTTTLTPIACL